MSDEKTYQQAFEEMMRDPHYAAQLTISCLFNVAVRQLMLSGFTIPQIHAMVDTALQEGAPPPNVSPWVYLLAFVTVQLAQVASPSDVHQLIDINSSTLQRANAQL